MKTIDKENKDICSVDGCDKEWIFKGTMAIEDALPDGTDEFELRLCNQHKDEAIHNDKILIEEECYPEELLPCPFCGAPADYSQTSTIWAECTGCGTECGVTGTRIEAMNGWNQRA